MIFYQWDAQGIYFTSLDADETGALPERSTPTAPPEFEGEQVARWAGTGWEILDSAPEPEPGPAPDWPALIAVRRYIAETGGTTVQGMPLDTQRDSQSMLTGAALAASLDAQYSVQWKTGDGFVTLTSAQILGLASAVRAHVQACFDREASLLDAVADGSITAEMLEDGWPA